MRDSLDHCVKCTICETFCPVSNVTPLFPGPKYVGPQAERFRVADEPSPDASLDYCSGCGICTQVCPQGVHIAEINTQARAQLKETHGRQAARPHPRPPDAGGPPRARRWRRSPTGRCATGRCGSSIEKTIGHPPRAPMPTLRRPDVPALGASAHRAAGAARRVAFFHGCGTNYYEPRLGEMTVALLEHNGIAVEVPKQDCCGLPLQSNGLFDDARGYVHRLAARLAPYAREGDRHRRHVDELHADAQARGARDPRAWATTPDLRVGLRARLRHLRVPARDARARRAQDGLRAASPETVTYHAPCQQQGHGIGKPALDLMALDPRADGGRERRDLLRRRRDVRAQDARSTTSRWRSAPGCSRQIARRPRPTRRVRLRDLPLADRARDGRAHGAPGRDAPPRRRASPDVRGRPRHRLPQRGAGRGRRRSWRARWAARRWRSRRPAGWTTARSAPTPSA